MTTDLIRANDVEITCHPADGILTVSAETVAALDLLALTMPATGGWRIDVNAPAATLTAKPAHRQEHAA